MQVPATHAHHAAAPAAVADPTRRARRFYEKNEPVFRKGHRFVLFPETVRYVDHMVTASFPSVSHADRLAKWSLIALAGVPVGIAFLTFWAVWVDTSPTLSDEERIRGWETVVRELPATLFLIGVVLVGMTLAVRAGRYGATSAAQKAIWLHGVALYIVLAIVTGGSAENIMETRSSTVKWLLFPAQVAITALVVFVARKMVLSRHKI